MKINGVVVERDTQKKETTPTINQILDKMESNFQMINSPQNYGGAYSQKTFDKTKTNFFDDKNFGTNLNPWQSGNANQKVETESFEASKSNQFEDKSNLLLSILPAMLSQNKSPKTMDKQKDILINELLKNSGNPMLAKLFKLLPQLSTKGVLQNVAEAESNSNTQKQEPKIDSFKKTDDYQNIQNEIK